MHIAICDDNVADRKQMERLLGRESDARRNTTGILYIDSFGDSSSLLNAPMLYDLFFIDLHEKDCDGMGLAERLRQAGVTAPIVLCCSVTDYRTLPNTLPAIHFLSKPVRTANLPPMIDMAIAERSSAAHTVEIRGEQSTHYVEPDSILYALPKGHLTHILFENGESLDMMGNLEELYYLLESTKSFLFVKKNMLANVHVISAVSLFKLTISTGETFSIGPTDYAFIKKYWPPK